MFGLCSVLLCFPCCLELRSQVLDFSWDLLVVPLAFVVIACQFYTLLLSFVLDWSLFFLIIPQENLYSRFYFLELLSMWTPRPLEAFLLPIPIFLKP